MSVCQSRVSFPLNFASPLSVMIHNSPEIFYLKHIVCSGQKELIKVQFFRLSRALMKVQRIPHAIFENARSGFIEILHNCSVS